MNKIEKVAYKWLIQQGFKKEDITFRSNKTPDFIIKGSNGFEVKLGKGTKTKNIIIYDTQLPDLIKEANTQILVFEKGIKYPISIISTNILTAETKRIENISITWIKYDKSKVHYNIKVPKKTWVKFTKTLNKGENIKDVLTSLITKFIEKHKDKAEEIRSKR